MSVVTPLSSKTDSGIQAGVLELTSIALDVPVGTVRGPGRRRQVRSMRKFAPATTLAMLIALPAQAQTQGDPAGSSPLLAALNWVQGTLLGNVATSAAVIAIAVVGFLMLTGRIEWKRGLVVVVGAFIIFGAEYSKASEAVE